MPEDFAQAKQILAVVDWLDKLAAVMPGKCAMVWQAHEEPAPLHSWSLYSLDDYDYVALLPPNSYHRWCEDVGPFGGCSIETVDLPNGWQIVVGYHG